MAGRMPVGQVWIRVSPDTRGFANETRDQLKKMKSLDKYKVPIEVEVDIEKIEDDFDNAIKRLQDKAEKAEYKVRIQTELEWRQGDAKKQVRDHAEKYQDIADNHRVKIKTNLDADRDADAYSPRVGLDIDERGFERDVKRLMEKTKADLKVTVDKRTIREQIRETVDEAGGFLKRLMEREQNKLQIQVETKNLHEAEMRLAALQKHYNGAAEAQAASHRELARVTGEYNAIKRSVSQIGEAMLRVNLRTEEGAEEYERLADKMGKLNRQLEVYGNERKRLMKFGRINYLQVETNMDSMREAEERIEELRDRVNEIASEIDVGLDRTSVAAVTAELFAIVRPRVVHIFTSIHQNKQWKKFWSQADSSAANLNQSIARYATQIVGLRLLYKTMADMVQIVPKLDMMIPSVAAASVAAVAAISGASTLLMSVLTIGADLMRIFNLALMLPSVLAGAVGSALILGRAFKDFKTVFPEIISYYEELGKVVSDRVWKRAADNIRALQKSVEPLLDAKVPAWADAWGDSLGALADGIRDGVASGHLTEFFDNSIKGTKAAEAGWESLGSALTRMIGIGSRFFPQMGTWFSDTMQSFEDWVKENDKNGNFERWIEDAGKAFSDLGRVIGATGSILRSLALAGREAGLPSLTDFADGMSGLADKMKQPGAMRGFILPLQRMIYFVEQLSTLAPLAGDALENLWAIAGQAALSLAGPLTGALEGILRAFASPEFKHDMDSFFEDMGYFIESITPGLESLVGEFGSMAEIVGIAAKSWGPAFNEMLLLFEDFGAGIHPGLADFLESTGPDLEQLVKDLRPEVEKTSKALGDLLGNESFQNFVRYLLDSLGQIATAALRAGAFLLNAFKGFAEWWDQQPEWFKDLSTDLIVLGAALPIVAIGFAAIGRALAPVIGLLKAVGGALKFLGGAMTYVGGALVASGLAKGGIGGLIARVLGRSLMLAGGPVGWAALIASIIPYDIGAIIIDGIVHALGFDDTWWGQLVHQITDRIQRAIGGRTIFGIIWDGLKTLFSRDASLPERIWGLVTAIFPPLLILKAIADAIIVALFENGNPVWFFAFIKNAIEHKIAGIGQDIYNAFEGAWEALKLMVTTWQPKNPILAAGKWLFEKFVQPIIDWIFGLDTGSGDIEEALGANSPWAIRLGDNIKKALDNAWKGITESVTSWEPGGGGGSKGSIDGDGMMRFIKKLFGEDPGGSAERGVDEVFGVVTPRMRAAMDRARHQMNEAMHAGEGGKIESLLGMGTADIARIDGNATLVQSSISRMSTGVSATYGSMRTTTSGTLSGMSTDTAGHFSTMDTNARSKAEGMARDVENKFREMHHRSLHEANMLANETSTRFTNMQLEGSAKAMSLDEQVSASFSGMRGKANTQTAGMSTETGGNFSTMEGTAVSKAKSMESQTVAHMTAMAARSIAQVVALQGAAIGAMTTAQAGVVAQGSAMNSAYVAQMTSMSTRSIRVANDTRSGLIRVLTIDASGPGRSTGSSFVSGLSSGLSAAAGVARGIRDGVRSALSFSAYGSGQTVGGSFASGIASRIGAARDAASALARAARAQLPNSPAKEGPFSGSGWGGWGESIGDELAKGLRNSATDVAYEAQSLMTGVHDALDAKAEVGLGISTSALADSLAGAEIDAAMSVDGQLTAADIENGVASGLARLIEPAKDRDVVAIVRKAHKNGAL